MKILSHHKYSKRFFSIVGLTTISSLTLAACGSKTRDYVLINLPFQEKSPQLKTIQGIIDNYNSYIQTNEYDQKTKRYKNGYLPVRTKEINGYANNQSTIVSQLSVRDSIGLPNLTLGYGSTVYEINSKGKLFDFSKSTAEDDSNNAAAKAFTNDGIKKDIFEDNFLVDNSAIDKVPESGLYLLPFGASTDLLYVSKPVVQNFLALALKEKKITLKSSDKEWFKTQFGIDENKADDRADGQGQYKPSAALEKEVQKNFGNTVTGNWTTDSSSSHNNLEISKSDFESYTNFFKLVKLMVEHSKFDNKSGHKWIASFGQANLFELLSFLKDKTDYSNFLWSKNKDTQTYTYSLFKDKTNNQYKTLQEVYGLVSPAGQLGAYWSSTQPGTYPSTAFKTGKLAFSFSSNAGFSYLYNHDPKTTNGELTAKDILILGPPLVYKDNDNQGAFTLQGPKLLGIKSDNAALDHASRLFVNWLYSDKSQQTMKADDNTSYKFNSAEWFALNSGYIPGTKSFWTQKFDNAKLSKIYKNDRGVMAAYELIQSTIKDAGSATVSGASERRSSEASVPTTSSTSVPPSSPTSVPTTTTSEPTYSWGLKKLPADKIKAFVEPVGILSAAFRATADGNNKVANGKYPDFNTFWSNLTSQPQINGYIINNFKNKK